ncbi:MAG: phosphatidylglycerophosphatase A [Campylobacteraceae bacterium]|jgi:phosphatidylglycerophosphatase A|nr:phosphatidylglycerophosphatase A [Campylobacteraceae bacterium]
MQKIFLTFFYSGLCPKAPGTAGTILGALAAWFLLIILSKVGSAPSVSIFSLFLLTVLISIAAIDVINRHEAKIGIHDHQQIVIDEVVGVWFAICVSFSTGFLQILLCVIFFRIFDIKKPSVIGRIDKNVKGGLGVVGDDLLAGLFAGIISAGIWQLISKIEFVQNLNY